MSGSNIHTGFRSRKGLARHLPNVFRYAVLSAIAVIMIFPFFWMATTSLKTMGEAFAYPPRMFPGKWQWANYAKVFDTVPMFAFLFNSVKITTLCVSGLLISSAMAAFAISQLRFLGRKALYMTTLLILMVPYQVMLIPVFILCQHLGWKNTHYPLWVPAFFGSAFGVFLLHQFFQSIPRSLFEAALIDGCSPGRVLFSIYLPLSKPALATLAVFTFMASWNDFLNPIIYIDTLEKMPLTAGLSFLQSMYGSDWPLTMAGALISIMPILIIYFLAQRFFVEGIATSGLKG